MHGQSGTVSKERGIPLSREGKSSSSSSLLSSLIASAASASSGKQEDDSSVHETAKRADIEVKVDYYDADDQQKAGENAPKACTNKLGPHDFEALKVLGTGAYGKVYLVRKKDSNSFYAMKVLRKASLVLHCKDKARDDDSTARKLSFTDLRNALLERKILEAIQHPFIVKLYYAFQTDHKLYLVLHYGIGGELFYWLEKQKIFNESQTAFYSAEILLALHHLHGLSIIYRDLKPENVLLDGSGHILLTDFGLSKVALESRTLCGTADYMAPEIVQELSHNYAVDLWSLGVLAYDMLVGKPPFQSSTKKKTMDAILHKKVAYPKHISPFGKDFISRLLKKNPSDRLGYGQDGFKKLKQHGIFRKIDWAKLEAFELEPPFRPPVSGPADTNNFRSAFTSMNIEEAEGDSGISAFIDIPKQHYRNLAAANFPWENVRTKTSRKATKKTCDEESHKTHSPTPSAGTASENSVSLASSASEVVQVQFSELFKGFSFVRE